MDYPPLALLPCRLMLALAGLLIAPAVRPEWEQEWFAELWYRLLEGFRGARGDKNDGTLKRALLVYRLCFGCFRDAWCLFEEQGAGKERVLEKARSPLFCLMLLGTCLCLTALLTGGLKATRKIIEPLPFTEGDSIAIVSRTGRLEPVRRGIPLDIAFEWRKRSRFVQGLAFCSFPRQVEVASESNSQKALLLTGSTGLFGLLGASVPEAASGRSLFISEAFWRREYHSDRKVVGRTLRVSGKEKRIAGILPANFWFLSPAIDVYQIDSAVSAAQGIAVVRCRPGTGAATLKAELEKAAERLGYEFSQTAPHVVFLRDALQTPLWLFGTALLVGLVLVLLAHGSRWMRVDDSGDLLPRRSGKWWAFFAVKTALALVTVLAAGIEIFVGENQQAISEAFGGPVLIWFYTVGCSLVLFASISDQRSRCRVCQRLLAFPIRVGCPGCVFLDWAGTEFLCPQGHGILYVPHHVSCWEETDRWVMLEV